MYQFEIIRIGTGGVDELEIISQSIHKHLRPYAKISSRNLKESSFSPSTLPQARRADSQRLLEAMNPDAFRVLLSEHGKTFDSAGFSRWIDAISEHGARPVQFLLAGAPGVTPELSEHANATLSLSPMTFTHDMAHTLLLEQLYRAMTILKGKTYHY